MSLYDVHHQSHAQRLIQRAVEQGRVPHAYLFHGPDGVGKETLACGLAQLLLCDSPVERRIDGESEKDVGVDVLRIGCGSCVECRAVASGTHPDLHLIYRQLNREHPDLTVRKRKALDIGVDVLRHFLISRVGLTPIRGRAKLFIVREADRITSQAQNALLKTLEEPPGTTYLILLVTSLDLLLPTTLSRCQVVRFDALPTSFVQEGLRRELPDLSGDRIQWYAQIGDGSLGRALRYAGDDLHGLNERLLEGFADLVTGGSGDRGRSKRNANARSDKVASTWIDESKGLGDCYRKRDPEISDTEAGRRGLQSIFHLAAGWYADVLRVTNGDSAPLLNAQWRSRIEAVCGFVDASRAIEAINRIAQAENHLKLNVNTQLCVETLVNDLARTAGNKVVGVGS